MKLNSSQNNTPDIFMHKSIDAHGTNNDLGATLTRNLYYKEQVTNVPAEYYSRISSDNDHGPVSGTGLRTGTQISVA